MELRTPRIPLLPDPLRRIDLPADLAAVTDHGPQEDPEAGGLDRRTVEQIWEAALNLYRTGVHPALQLCLRRHGRVVLDRAIGHASGNGPGDPRDGHKQPATTDTPFCVYSTSKAVTAIVIHLLDERGALSIEDRVTDYIPEYGKHGKGETTIAHVLAHKAGVPTLPRNLLKLENLEDRELIIGAIADRKPFVQPGTMLAYHAVSGGFILDEIVRRATGQTVRDVLSETILEPLGFRWGNYGVRPQDLDRPGRDYVTGPPLFPPLSNLVTRVLGAPLDEVVEMSADRRFLTDIVPSANVVTTANELSRFFEIFRAGGTLDGVRVMAPETLRRALTEQARLEFDLSLGFPVRFSYGMMLGAKLISPYGLDTDLAFGHLGLINIMGWADPERAISCGLITSGKAILYPEVLRFYALIQRITSSAPKVAPQERLF